MSKQKVLLTASYGPNELGWGEDQYDLMASRLARGHGIYGMTAHCHYLGLYLIAENISNPTTVLENPHWDEFDHELDQGYDVVGIQLKSLHTKKVARMVRRIREKSPGTKIVIGGYGVNTLATPVPGDKDGDAVYIRENADYLCREEGVRFMRRILDDHPIEREITQYTLPTTGFSIGGLPFEIRIPTILVALGCPNACDFCNTSAMFNHKKIYVAEPEQVYRFMRHYQKRVKTEDFITLLFDEDIFMNQEYVRELGRLIRSDRKTWGLQWFSFGSMRSLSNFDVEELRDCGLGAVWIGVESFICGDNCTTDQYGKRAGKEIREMFQGLHRNGIQTVGSLVLGFDFHDHENLKEDIDKFVELKPTLYQISPLTPCPGTALYDRMSEEGRILDTYEWKDFNLWKDDVFQLKNFKPGEIKGFFDYAHDKIRSDLGPQPLQLLESSLDLHQSVKDLRGDFYEYKVERARDRCRAFTAYSRAIQWTHPDEKVRKRARMLVKRYEKEVGFMGPGQLIADAMSVYISRQLKKESKKPPGKIVSDPDPRWSYYNTFDDRVWVKKGRKAKKPRPYRDGMPVHRTKKFFWERAS